VTRLSTWTRELVTHFAPALVPAWRALGLKGVYMCVCAWPLRCIPFPVEIPGMGRLTNRDEFCNFLGNFCEGETRCAEVETFLRGATAAVVVDVGVNVGMTVRQWFFLAPGARVIGLDMMQEALELTTGRLLALGGQYDWQPICGVVTAEAGQVEVSFDEPLSGTNALGTTGRQRRTIPADTLDRWIKAEQFGEIALVKVDVEGHGAAVLAGAERTLARARFLALEIHSSAELEDCARILFPRGWLPFAITGRNTWWRKSGGGVES
jgi:FkbM family methyltransferase